jgi:hypothetical protein
LPGVELLSRSYTSGPKHSLAKAHQSRHEGVLSLSTIVLQCGQGRHTSSDHISTPVPHFGQLIYSGTGSLKVLLPGQYFGTVMLSSFSLRSRRDVSQHRQSVLGSQAMGDLWRARDQSRSVSFHSFLADHYSSLSLQHIEDYSELLVWGETSCPGSR